MPTLTPDQIQSALIHEDPIVRATALNIIRDTSAWQPSTARLIIQALERYTPENAFRTPEHLQSVPLNELSAQLLLGFLRQLPHPFVQIWLALQAPLSFLAANYDECVRLTRDICEDGDPQTNAVIFRVKYEKHLDPKGLIDDWHAAHATMRPGSLEEEAHIRSLFQTLDHLPVDLPGAEPIILKSLPLPPAQPEPPSITCVPALVLAGNLRYEAAVPAIRSLANFEDIQFNHLILKSLAQIGTDKSMMAFKKICFRDRPTKGSVLKRGYHGETVAGALRHSAHPRAAELAHLALSRSIDPAEQAHLIAIIAQQGYTEGLADAVATWDDLSAEEAEESLELVSTLYTCATLTNTYQEHAKIWHEMTLDIWEVEDTWGDDDLLEGQPDWDDDDEFLYDSDAPMLRVLEPIIREEPKIGCNAPCPCGSGKKYKKCCGK